MGRPKPRRQYDSNADLSWQGWPCASDVTPGALAPLCDKKTARVYGALSAREGHLHMRWARFEQNGTPAYGVVEGEEIIPVRGSPFDMWERTSAARRCRM